MDLETAVILSGLTNSVRTIGKEFWSEFNRGSEYEYENLELDEIRKKLDSILIRETKKVIVEQEINER